MGSRFCYLLCGLEPQETQIATSGLHPPRNDIHNMEIIQHEKAPLCRSGAFFV